MIGVVGLGFVGLTTALGIAEKTNKIVYGYDSDETRFSCINRGEVPFYEPGLPEALKKHKEKNFFLATSPKELSDQCHVLFYCVGTPAKGTGEADLTILEKALRQTLEGTKGKTVVIKSTVPPGTTDGPVADMLRAMGFTIGKDIFLVNNPEFLREGYSWDDFVNPDRVIIGQWDERSGEQVAEIYKDFGAPIHRVTLNTGEFIKYLSNTLLATLISYSNEMAMAADTIGSIQISEAFKILYQDKRWSGEPAKMTSYLYPGCGYGGYCLPKDTQAMRSKMNHVGTQSILLDSVINTNENVKTYIIEKIKTVCKEATGNLKTELGKDVKIGVLGLSFKPDSDDVRDTPASHIIQGLLADGYEKITGHDPMAIEPFRATYDMPISYESQLGKIISESDVLVLVTAWPCYQEVAAQIKAKKYVDARYYL